MNDAPVTYPQNLEIMPLKGTVNASVHVPGSKSITNRVLILAALAGRGQDCFIRNLLRSEDTEIMLRALHLLGFDVLIDPDGTTVRVGSSEGTGLIPAPRADLFLGNSGTSMRFLTALVSLGRGRYRLDGIARMRERPIGDLLDALQTLGVSATSEDGNGCPPVIVKANGLRGGVVRIRG